MTDPKRPALPESVWCFAYTDKNNKKLWITSKASLDAAEEEATYHDESFRDLPRSEVARYVRADDERERLMEAAMALIASIERFPLIGGAYEGEYECLSCAEVECRKWDGREHRRVEQHKPDCLLVAYDKALEAWEKGRGPE